MTLSYCNESIETQERRKTCSTLKGYTFYPLYSIYSSLRQTKIFINICIEDIYTHNIYIYIYICTSAYSFISTDTHAQHKGRQKVLLKISTLLISTFIQIGVLITLVFSYFSQYLCVCIYVYVLMQTLTYIYIYMYFASDYLRFIINLKEREGDSTWIVMSYQQTVGKI